MNAIHIIAPAKFACQRSCTPGKLCRFTPVLDAIGPARVTSHTVTVEVQFKHPEALAAAVQSMGGTWLGPGTHKLYSRNQEAGHGFTMPNWTYPLVLREDNTLAFDDYHGSWGNVEDIKKLTGRYAIESARQAADQQGWTSQDQADGSLIITHPSGATMTVQEDGTVDSVGFIGAACDIASVIENAMGTPGDRANKPEYWESQALTL